MALARRMRMQMGPRQAALTDAHRPRVMGYAEFGRSQGFGVASPTKDSSKRSDGQTVTSRSN